MDEFEKIRAFSEQMSRQTEQAVANEEAEVRASYASSEETPETIGPASEKSDNPNFLEEWNTEQSPKEPAIKSLSKTFWIVFSLTTLVLGALIVVFWLLLKMPMDKGEVVSIAPTPNAVKVKPENPGGAIIPDQDKEIYTRLTQDTVPVRVEKLVETQEEIPVFPPVVTDEEIPEVELSTETIEIITEEPPHKETPPVQAKEKTLSQKAATSSTKVSPKVSSHEKWRIQLFSSSDKKKVEKTWKVISAKHKKLLANMPMDIEKAEISGKGTFYRLKIGDFPTKERAANLCAKLKKKHQDCLPIK